jgi:hypothetical protein
MGTDPAHPRLQELSLSNQTRFSRIRRHGVYDFCFKPCAEGTAGEKRSSGRRPRGMPGSGKKPGLRDNLLPEQSPLKLTKSECR